MDSTPPSVWFREDVGFAASGPAEPLPPAGFIDGRTNSPGVTLRSRLTVWGAALLSTDRFFDARTPTDAIGGRVVVEVAALHAVWYLCVLVGGAAVASSKQPSTGVVENLADLGLGLYALSVGVGLLVIVNWVVVSAVLHVAITLRHGRGTIGDTMYVVAWSSPAALVAPLLWGTGFLLALSGSPLVMSYDAYVATAAEPAGIAGLIGGSIVLLWQGHLWPAGLERAHDVDHGFAVQASAVTVVLGLVALLLGA